MQKSKLVKQQWQKKTQKYALSRFCVFEKWFWKKWFIVLEWKVLEDMMHFLHNIAAVGPIQQCDWTCSFEFTFFNYDFPPLDVSITYLNQPHSSEFGVRVSMELV